jgi:hypothetical protein
MCRLTSGRSRAIHYDRIRGRQRDQPPLGRGKPCGIKRPGADTCHMAVPPVIAAVVFGQHHPLKHSPQLRAGHPQQHLGLGQALFDIEVVTVQGDTPVPIGRPGEQRVGEVTGQFVRSVEPTFRRPEDLDGDRREAPIRQEPLMGGGVIELDEGLMAPLQLGRRAGEGELIVLQAPLDIEVCFHPVEVAFTLRTDDGLMPDL